MAITPITKKRILYSDVPKDLTIHPVSNDVSRLLNENAVKESIKNLVLTNRGERLFQPDVGCDITSQLFETFAEDTVDTIRNMVIETLDAYEPRAEILDVDVEGRIDSNEITVTVTFLVINSEEPSTVEIILNRIR